MHKNQLTLFPLSFFCSFFSEASAELTAFVLEAVEDEADFFECDVSLFRDDLWSSSLDELELSADGYVQITIYDYTVSRMNEYPVSEQALNVAIQIKVSLHAQVHTFLAHFAIQILVSM